MLFRGERTGRTAAKVANRQGERPPSGDRSLSDRLWALFRGRTVPNSFLRGLLGSFLMDRSWIYNQSLQSLFLTPFHALSHIICWIHWGISLRRKEVKSNKQRKMDWKEETSWMKTGQYVSSIIFIIFVVFNVMQFTWICGTCLIYRLIHEKIWRVRGPSG